MRVKRLSGIVMRIAVVLLCLVLFSAHLASGMFARYSTSASSDASVRAAKYQVQIIPVTTGGLTFNETGEGTYQFRVSNKSEVPVSYTLVADATFTFKEDIHIDDDADSENDRVYVIKRILKDVKLNDEDAVPDSDYSRFTFPTFSDLILAPGESADYELSVVTDIAAVYSTSNPYTTPGSDRWDHDWVNVQFNISAESVQIN